MYFTVTLLKYVNLNGFKTLGSCKRILKSSWNYILQYTNQHNEVFLIGAPEVKESIENIVYNIGEKIEVYTKKRLAPLNHYVDKVSLKELQKGDVVVAFSRRQVLSLASLISQQGFSVSTIYGALAPEVRRLQVARFINGASDIVVATDAIGMGLNLPAKRVIFSEVEKYDGNSMRKLNRSECVQIAGRAGRYVEGLREIGYYAGMDYQSHRYLIGQINSTPNTLSGSVSIGPNYNHVEKLQTYLQPVKQKQLYTILSFFSNHTALDNGLFKVAPLYEMKALAEIVDLYDISLKDKFTLACAPINQRDEVYQLYRKWVVLFAHNQPIELGEIAPRITHDLQYAENISKKISLYSWLANKYPSIFVDVDKISDIRNYVSQCIDNILAKQNQAKQNLNKLASLDVYAYQQTAKGIIQYEGVFKGIPDLVRQHFSGTKKAFKRLNAACSEFDSGKRKASFNGWFFYRNPEKHPSGYSAQNLKRVLETELQGVNLKMFDTFCGNTM